MEKEKLIEKVEEFLKENIIEAAEELIQKKLEKREKVGWVIHEAAAISVGAVEEIFPRNEIPEGWDIEDVEFAVDEDLEPVAKLPNGASVKFGVLVKHSEDMTKEEFTKYKEIRDKLYCKAAKMVNILLDEIDKLKNGLDWYKREWEWEKNEKERLEGRVRALEQSIEERRKQIRELINEMNNYREEVRKTIEKISEMLNMITGELNELLPEEDEEDP